MSDTPTHKPKKLIGWLSPFVAATLAASVAFQSGAAGASAAPDPEPPPDLAVTSYASDYSVSLAEAQRRLDRIRPLQKILASIRDLEDARLAGWGINHDSNFRGWVWLTGDAAASAAAAAVAAAHADVEIRTGADHSLTELLTVQQGLFRNSAVGRVSDGPASGVAAMVTFTGIDMAANAVRIGIDPALATAVPGGLTNVGSTTVSDETFQTKAAEVTQQLRGHINVNYVVEDGRGLSNDATFTGGQGMIKCTSGFTAKQRGASVYGIITAAHCTETSQESLVMRGVTLSPVTRVWGPYVDAQFQSVPTGSSHRLLNEFFCGGIFLCKAKRDESRNQMMGDLVCHYGLISGHSCGTVNDIHFFPTAAGICEYSCANTFIRVEGDSLISCRGDSGGPWHRGGIAYGIHSGSSAGCVPGRGYAWFSAIQDVENELGVDILTSGPITAP